MNVVNRRNEKKLKQNKNLKMDNFFNSVQIEREKKIKYTIVLIKVS